MAVFSLGERKVVFQGEEWFIAHNATVIGTVILRNQASVWFKSVVRGDSDIIAIGERTNIQDAAVLHADPGVRSPSARTSPSATWPCSTAAPSATDPSSHRRDHHEPRGHRQRLPHRRRRAHPEGKKYPTESLSSAHPGRWCAS